jgi:tetratricopeptide (TPR) repeat protein
VASGRVGIEQIDDLEQAVTFFRRWDAAGNGGLHRKAVVGQLNAVAETLRENHSPGASRRLFHVAAELAQLAGWMTYDAGSFELAQRYYLLALDACKHAEALDLGAKIVGDMTQLSTAAGNYDDSLAMVRTALASLPRGASPHVRSELHGLEARAYAQLGGSEVSNARRSVDACVEVFEEATADAQPDWIHYMNRAEVECLAANAYTELALHEEEPRRALVHACYAEMHTHNAIESRSASYARSRVLDDIRLSKVRLAQQEPVEAATVAIEALRRAAAIRSSVVVKWFVNLGKPLAARYGDVPAVGTFQSELRDYVKRFSPGSGQNVN